MGLRPESLINPGFQMSFAAVVALIFVFQRAPVYRGDRPLMRWVIVPGALLLVSSLVAGTATAPYAAAHFNRVAHYGLVANLLAVPAMGLMVMPGAVILAILGPLGLEQPALWTIETGSRWILFVASEVAATPGAMSAVVRPPDAMLPLLTLGLLTMILWQGRLRWVGALPVVAAVMLWVGASRPDLLVADSGGLIGVMAEAGRSLSKPRGDGFAAGIWLENDGVLTTQEEAATPGGIGQQDRISRAVIGGTQVLQVSGITALAKLKGCDGADLLIANVDVDGPRPCEVYDIRRLRQTGALAGWLVDGVLEINTVADRTGTRPWTGPPDGAWGGQNGRGGLMATLWMATLWRNAQ
jgi:competence protein ComEC